MIQVAADDLLRALKRCKGIAKQELLIKEQTQNQEARKAHAEARREIYNKLIELIETSGIENACAFALNEYRSLPERNEEPVIKGRSQALEMFFNIIGIDSGRLKESKTNNYDLVQLLNTIDQQAVDCCVQ